MIGAERFYELGGRRFLTVQEMTVKQDLAFLALTREAGLDGLTMGAGESPEDFAERILGALVENDAVLKILGLLLVPPAIRSRRLPFQKPGTVPSKWTPEVADETAAFLGSLSTPKDKAQIRALILTLLIHFFGSGIGSLWTTETSSVDPIPENDTSDEELSPSPTDTGSGPESS